MGNKCLYNGNTVDVDGRRYEMDIEKMREELIEGVKSLDSFGVLILQRELELMQKHQKEPSPAQE